MNVLESDSINLTFRGRTILSDIYLRCSSGEVIGLIGRNGSGKSCLMQIIFGSLKGENQSVRVNGRLHNQPACKSMVINYLPQNPFLLDYLTLNELIKIFDLDPEVLAVEELNGLHKEKLGQLSYGQKRLIEIMTILYAPAQFSLLDEPFSYLAPKLVQTIVLHIQKQSRRKGIILSDHQYKTVMKTCDRFYLLTNGALRSIKTLSDLENYRYINPKSEATEDRE
ncbi:MAG: ATP-binding cassette domain-containing protein [Cyclobacteriaceae bacterium]